MLLRNSKVHPNTIKDIAEIILDGEKFDKAANALSNTVFSRDRSGYQQLAEFVNKYNSSGRYSPINLDKLFNDIKVYIAHTGLNNFYRDYCMTSRLKAVFASRVRENTGKGTDIRGLDINGVVLSFHDWFMRYSLRSYSEDSGTLSRYLVNAFNSFYLKPAKGNIFKEINNMNRTVMKSSEGDDLDLGDLVISYESESVVEDASFDFRTDVRKIYEASRILFSNKANNSSEFLSDLVACYKRYRVTKCKSKISKSVATMFCPNNTNSETRDFLTANEYFIPIRVVASIPLTSDYASSKFAIRYKILECFFKNEGSSNIRFINKLYKEAKAADTGNKNSGNQLFDDTMINNQKLFMQLFEGYRSVIRLENYCRKNKIDMFSIPPDIFRTDQYIKRFDNLIMCLKCYPRTSSLIGSEVYNESTGGIYDNDAVYEFLLNSDNIGSFNFASINEKLVKSKKQVVEIDTLNKYYQEIFSECGRCGMIEKVTRMSQLKSVVVNVVAGSEGMPLNTTILKKMTELQYQEPNEGIADFLNSINDILKPMLYHVTDEDTSDFIDVMNILKEDDSNFNYVRVFRYLNIRLAVLERLALLLAKLVASNDFDIINDLSNSKSSIFKVFPKSISSKSELINFDSRIEPYFESSGSLTELRETSMWYDQVVQHEYKEVVDFVNKMVEDKLKYLTSLGIDIEGRSEIGKNLINISNYIYMEKVDNAVGPKFQHMKEVLEYPDGYFLKDGSPVTICEGKRLIHAKGYAVPFENKDIPLDAILAISEDDIPDGLWNIKR